MALDNVPRLPCGRPVDAVWMDLEEPPTPHELSCVYCQDARRSLDDLTAATLTLTKVDETNPDLQPPESLIGDIMKIARAEVRRSRRISLDRPRAGVNSNASLIISELAVAAVIREIADAPTYGAEARRCRIEVDLGPEFEDPSSETNATDGIVDDAGDGTDSPEANRIRVELSVSLAAGQPLLGAVERLRAAIARGVSEQLGLIASRIDIVVEDLHDLS